MNAKKYLQNHRQLNFRINSAITEINDLHAKATAVGSFDYSKDRVLSSPSSDAPYVDIIAEIDKREKKLKNMISEWLEQKKQIEVMIDNHEPMNERDVLRCRYLKYMRFEDIAKELDYSLDWIYTLHHRAINSIGKRKQ